MRASWLSPVLSLVLILMALLVGCEPAPPPTPTPSPTPTPPQYGTLSGVVTDLYNGALALVSVSISGAWQGSATTNAQGQFQLSNLPVGSYTVSFSVNGFEGVSRSAQVRANQNTPLQVQLKPESLPSAGNRGVRVATYVDYRLDFEVDVVIVNADGTPLSGLASSAFSIQDFSELYFHQQSSAELVGRDQGAYSAVLLMDQSGSIVSTDPYDSRLQAGKIFFSALTPPDNAMLAAFASAGSLPYEVTSWGDFSSSGSRYYPLLDRLSSMEGGDTPLYKSTAIMTDVVATEGPNPNKAVVVFTDGKDNDGTWTLAQLISRAQSKNVKLFTVGLSDQIDVAVLSQMAAQTGGTMMRAREARQLVSIYGSLGNLLRGSARFYRTRWSVTDSRYKWVPGDWFYTAVRVQTPTGTYSAPFYLEIPSTSAQGQVSFTRPEGVDCPTGPAVNNEPVLCKLR